MAKIICFALLLALAGCDWMFQTRPTPKVGDIYALHPDAFCMKPRVLVTGVEPRYVRIRHFDGLSVETVEEMYKFTDNRPLLKAYELDPHKCVPGRAGERRE